VQDGLTEGLKWRGDLPIIVWASWDAAEADLVELEPFAVFFPAKGRTRLVYRSCRI
jgi:hypothetical protein